MKHHWHPLLMLAAWARWTPAEVMDWLQGNGWVSDLCVDAYDVAVVDVGRVVVAAEGRWLEGETMHVITAAMHKAMAEKKAELMKTTPQPNPDN